MNREGAAEKIHPLAHADQPEALSGNVLRVEPAPLIGNAQQQAAVAALQIDGCVGRAAVPDDVMKPLLHDAVEAQRHVRLHFAGDVVVLELNSDPMLRGHIATESLKGRHEPHRLEPRGVKLVRQMVEIAGDVAGA